MGDQGQAPDALPPGKTRYPLHSWLDEWTNVALTIFDPRNRPGRNESLFNYAIPTHFRRLLRQSCPVNCQKVTDGGKRYASTHSRPRRLNGVGGESHASATLPPGQRPGTLCTKGWVSLEACLTDSRKCAASGFEP